MLPVWGSKTTVSAGTSTSRTIVTPASTSKNNLVVAVITILGPAVTVSAPGYTVKQIHIGGAEEHTFAVLFRVATESGENPIEISWEGANRRNAAYSFRVTGENTLAAVEASVVRANEEPSKSMTFDSVTTGQDEVLSILLGSEGIEGEASVTPPAGYTTRQTISEGCGYVATGELAKAGASGEKVCALATARESATIHLAIAPEEVPPEEVFEQPTRIPSSAGTVYYVSPTGSDSTGNGTKGNPYKTVAHALVGKVPGSIIECAGATYPLEELHGFAGTAKAPITVRSAAGETAKFEWSGSGFEAFRISECSYMRFERIEFGENHGVENTLIYGRDSSHHIEFYRCTCHDGQRSNFYKNSTCWHWHFVNCISYRAGRRQESTHNLDHGFYLDGAPGDVEDMCLNCLAYDNDADGFAPHEHTTASYFINCTAVHNGRSGFNLGGDMTRTYVVNCIAAFNGQQGEGYGFRDAGSTHGNFVRNVISFGNIGEPTQFRNANPGYVLGAHKEEDPEFVNPEAHDYRLQPTSPAVGYGDAKWAGSFDLVGHARSATPAVGAYELATKQIRVRHGGEWRWGRGVSARAAGAFKTLLRHARVGGAMVEV